MPPLPGRIFYKTYLFYGYGYFAYRHVCIQITCVPGIGGGQKRALDPVELAGRIVVSHHGVLRSKSSLLQDQQVLLTSGPSLQSDIKCSWNISSKMGYSLIDIIISAWETTLCTVGKECENVLCCWQQVISLSRQFNPHTRCCSCVEARNVFLQMGNVLWHALVKMQTWGLPGGRYKHTNKGSVVFSTPAAEKGKTCD